MGIEAVKSSTPAACREYITDALKLIMKTDEQTVQKFIADLRIKFRDLPFQDIAFPRGCRGLGYDKEGYGDKKNIYYYFTHEKNPSNVARFSGDQPITSKIMLRGSRNDLSNCKS